MDLVIGRTQAGRQADRQTGRQAHRQTGRQADRQTGRHGFSLREVRVVDIVPLESCVTLKIRTPLMVPQSK